MGRRRTKTRQSGAYGTLVAVLVFVLIAAVLVVGTLNLSQGADDEGTKATYEAIRRAAVLCYASEGFYPPGITYIEDHYGVQVDRTRYAVQYEVFAYNVMPSIRVVPRGTQGTGQR